MHFRDFSVHNRRRCESYHGFKHPLDAWSLAEWLTAVTGELGEVAGVIKEGLRNRDGVPGKGLDDEALKAMLADEIADTFIYLDLLAQAAGIDLEEAVCTKFRKTSDKIGYGHQSFDLAR